MSRAGLHNSFTQNLFMSTTDTDRNFLEESLERMNLTTDVKYHGLVNQGATCYLNSVLQVLFMTKDFRAAVERHKSENCDTACIDPYLKTLFDDLKSKAGDTSNITKKLGIDTVYEQRDAAEYFEKILNLTSPEASEIFHGQLTNMTKCSTCGTETGSAGPFWHLPLALVDSYSEPYSVLDGIEEYFRASEFSGEKQMYCHNCDDKSDATTKCEIKHHPDVLMLLLKRFEFDYRYMTYIKINRTVNVPCTLQIPEKQTYELYAVVDHFGDLLWGHYTATIKDDERWYKFDDTTVTLLDYQPFHVDNFEKSYSAYLLFYRRNERAADTCPQDFRETPAGFIPATSDTCDQHKDVSLTEEVEGNMEEDIEGNAEAAKIETFSGEIHLEESIEVQDSDNERQRTPEISHDFKPDVSDRYAVHVNKQDETRGAESRVMDVKTDEDGKERKGESLPKYSKDTEGLEDVREDISEDLGAAQEVGHDFNFVDKQRDEERKERDAKADDKIEVSNSQQDVPKDDQGDEGKKDNTDDMEGNAEAAKIETLSGETHLEESVEGQDSDNGRQRTPESSQDLEPEVRDAERRVMYVRTDESGKEKKGESLTKCPLMGTECQVTKGLEIIRLNISEDLGATQEFGQDHDLRSATVDKQRDKERKERGDIQADEEGKPGERGRASGRGKLLTIYNLVYPSNDKKVIL